MKFEQQLFTLLLEMAAMPEPVKDKKDKFYFKHKEFIESDLGDELEAIGGSVRKTPYGSIEAVLRTSGNYNGPNTLFSFYWDKYIDKQRKSQKLKKLKTTEKVIKQFRQAVEKALKEKGD
jgi:hypothetical protein